MEVCEDTGGDSADFDFFFTAGCVLCGGGSGGLSPVRV